MSLKCILEYPNWQVSIGSGDGLVLTAESANSHEKMDVIGLKFYREFFV